MQKPSISALGSLRSVFCQSGRHASFLFPNWDAVWMFKMIWCYFFATITICSVHYMAAVCFSLSPLSLQFPQTQRLMELQLMEGGCPPTVDTVHLWGYTHKMTLSFRSGWSGVNNIHTQVYLCQARVKGRSSTNEHSWFFADHAFKNRMT